MIAIATPQDDVRSLLRRAMNLQDQAEEALRKTRSPANPILGDLVVKTFVPHGIKGAVRSAGKRAYSEHKADIEARWREEAVRLKEQCVSTVSSMSIRTMNLTMAGNSRKLVTKFNKLTSKKRASTYIRNLASILEDIENLDLIWNTDIEDELKHRIEEKEWLRREEGALKVEARAIVEEARRSQFSKKDSMLNCLKSYPRSRQSLISALDQLQRPDLEAPRHCIFSCRVSIEQLCIDAGGSGNWKKGLSNLLSSKTDRSQVVAVWNNLSGKGAHGGHNPTPKEAEQCLALTLTTLEIILDNIQS